MIQNNQICVLSSSFTKSIENKSQAPSVLYSEIAILGRSNVGKSSAINLLLNNKNLAKSSSTPGKTRLINFFLSSWRLDDVVYDLRFIDFPGFGYAKVSKEERNLWDKNLSEFLKTRDSIKLFIHLIDSRHTNLAIDNEIKNFLNSLLKPDSKILSVFTKCDKLNKNELIKLKKEDSICISYNDKQSIESLRFSILNHLYGV
nr:ribosome biogenesis GTP-binding protein YihA/YsxC [Helicobacter sp. MIT 99-5507]